jgi:NAD+ kinase
MLVAIHGRPFSTDNFKFVELIWSKLTSAGAQIAVSSTFKKFTAKTDLKKLPVHVVYSDHKDFPDADYMISLGGDGSLLESVTFIGEKQTPVLGVNMGRLGFLAYTRREETEKAIDDLIHKKFKVANRSLIHLETGDPDLFGGVNFGLNECSLMKRDASSMVVVHAFLNGQFLNSYWSDGLVVSTPTGSTGYSLSCGGPLVMPDTQNFIIAPISPHNLNVRPMLVPDNSTLSFEIEGRSKNFLVSLDGRSRLVSPKTRITITKEAFGVSFIELPEYNFLKTLRDKLNWGLDSRN